MMNLDQLIGKIKKEHGDIAIRYGHEIPDNPRIPTGSIALDYLFGGGLPQGKIVEFQGPKSAGKSLIAMRVVDQQLKKYKRPAMWVDVERCWNKEWAKKQIGNYKQVQVVQLPTAEHVVEMVKDALYCDDPPGIIVVDSIAAMSSLVEQDRSALDPQKIGLSAQLISLAMRLWTHPADLSKCTIIMINQLRDDIGGWTPYGKRDKAPGGRAREFFASLMVEVRSGEWIKHKNEVVGHHVNVRILKSKVWGAKNFSQASLLFYYHCRLGDENPTLCESCDRYCPNKQGYFDDITEAIDVGIQLGVIQRAGPYYSFEDLKVQGREKLKEAMDDKMIARVRKACLKLIK